MRKIRMAAVAAASLITPTVVGIGAADAEESRAHTVDVSSVDPVDVPSTPTYTVTFRNLTEAQYFTPPNWAAHSNAAVVFQRGRPASDGVRAVAENGGVPVLAAELTAAVDDKGKGVSGVGAEAPVPPGGEVSWSFRSDERQFSLVSMLVCTNDGFGGIDAKNLPLRDGRSRTIRVAGYDAGTELNTERYEDIVPAPFCGGGGLGTDQSNPEIGENSVVRRHRGITGVGDLGPEFDWDNPVAEVVITRDDPTPIYRITVENLTDGQYLTPPNVAIHDRGSNVFRPGQPASTGVQAVAENGGVPVLAAELQANIDDAGLGASTVGDPDAGPIGPGTSRTFTLEADGRRISVVSMLICTNDGFAGLPGRALRLDQGQSRSYVARGYDAGTEINTESYEDLVPAPFCGGGGVGTGETNPELAENGVIRRHRGILGVGDLGAEFDWQGPVAKITVERL